MPGGYADSFDSAALSQVLDGFAGQDLTSEQTTEELDRKTYGRTDLLQHAELVVTGEAAFTGGAANDALEVTLEWEDSSTSGSGYSDFKTKTLSIAVDDNSTLQFACVLPVKLLKAERYLVGKAQVAAASGNTGSVSSCTGSAVMRVYPVNRVPTGTYDRDGYTGGSTLTA